MRSCGLEFRALTFQERISRLEAVLDCLARELELLKQLAGYAGAVAQDVATEFRACDGEVLIKNRVGDYRALLDEWFTVIQGEARIVHYRDQTRLGEFGMDDDGKFYALKHSDTQGEQLVLLASDGGLWIRDQNGAWGKVVRSANNQLIFVEV